MGETPAAICEPAVGRAELSDRGSLHPPISSGAIYDITNSKRQLFERFVQKQLSKRVINGKNCSELSRMLLWSCQTRIHITELTLAGLLAREIDTY